MVILVFFKDILIIGCEGGVYMQCCFFGVFYLNFEIGKYFEVLFYVSFRLGYIVNFIFIRISGENYLFVFGGCKSGGYELIGLWRKME